MKKSLPLLGAALGLALLITGCETDNSAARIQEKSAVYATLKPWQKKYIDTGVVAVNFTPDMVYMAVGNSSTKQATGDGEVWIYKNYYPTDAATKVKYKLSAENQLGAGDSKGAGSAQGGAGQSNSTKGGPMVLSPDMNTAELQAYTLTITFANGTVSKMTLDPK